MSSEGSGTVLSTDVVETYSYRQVKEILQQKLAETNALI
jgi:hypothetical protein